MPSSLRQISLISRPWGSPPHGSQISCALPRQCAAGLLERRQLSPIQGADALHRAGEELERVRLGDRPSLTLTDSRNTNRRPLAARRALEVPAPGGRSAHWRSVSWPAIGRSASVGSMLNLTVASLPEVSTRRRRFCFGQPREGETDSIPTCATRGHASGEAVCHWGWSPRPVFTPRCPPFFRR